MHKRLLVSLLVFSTGSACYGQVGAKQLLETAIHQTGKQTYSLLRTVSTAKSITVKRDSAYWTFGFNQPSYHLEYKMYRDTCVGAGVQFLFDDKGYERTVADIIRNTKPFGENRIAEKGGKKVILHLQCSRHDDMGLQLCLWIGDCKIKETCVVGCLWWHGA